MKFKHAKCMYKLNHCEIKLVIDRNGKYEIHKIGLKNFQLELQKCGQKYSNDIYGLFPTTYLKNKVSYYFTKINASCNKTVINI